MGSETEFVLRLQKDGVKAYWVPDAVVEHFVRTRQLGSMWLLRRAVRAGRGNHRLRVLNTAGEQARHPSLPRCLLRLARWSVQAPLSFFASDRQARFHAWWSLSYLVGYTLEAIYEQVGAAHARGTWQDVSQSLANSNLSTPPVHDGGQFGAYRDWEFRKGWSPRR